ncbi:MAG: hydrolase [Paenibacillus sp.]|jgi:ADP-ribose pyrophosphatase YjhB (NUDIX family)|nr:hydrolase [Paenibacillus sp.]
MSTHIRVRPTALIVKEDSILLVEYSDEHGLHYNLPGGGAEPGETVIDGVKREVWEETMAEVDVGRLALVYEYAPHRQSGDYASPTHTINLIFECRLKEGSEPRTPDQPDPSQTAVRWMRLDELDSIVLYPNIKQHIRQYLQGKPETEFIEDHQLESCSSAR